jgi:hypothetical protein
LPSSSICIAFTNPIFAMSLLAQQVIQELQQLTHELIEAAQELFEQDEERLNQRQSPQAWSAIECIAHLNLYSLYYLPEIQSVIEKSPYPAQETFHTGWLGNYFAQMMKPQPKMSKMKTMKNKNPLGSQLNKGVILQFIEDQKQMLQLLKKAQSVCLTQNKTGISITPIIRFRLGDTFRFVIYHNHRHIVQAQRAAAH